MKIKNALVISICIITGLLTGCRQTAGFTEEITSIPDYMPFSFESEYETRRRELAQIIDNFLTLGDGIFWGSVLVAERGNVIIHNAYGMACIEQNIKNTTDTPFQISSVTKQITGAAIIQLMTDGKLNSEDTLDMFFRDHEGLENVTVAHLLAMRGGFGCFVADFLDTPESVTGGPLIEAALERYEVLELINTKTVEELEEHILTNWSGEILENFRYSNSDYILLGRIIEYVSGMTYAEFIQTRIFDPIGMTDSGFSDTHKAATPHSSDGRALIRLPFAVSYSTGGIVSTPEDLNLWLDAYFGGKLFPETMLEQIFTGSGNYNYGWFFRNESVWQHPGASPDSRSIIIYDRDNEIRMILLSNRDHHQVRRIKRELSEKIFNIGIYS